MVRATPYHKRSAKLADDGDVVMQCT
jgi:hypothetical protein